MSERYKVRDQDKLHFITFATSYWLDVFTRECYKNIIVDSLKFCQQNKGLELYAWVLMTNHIHIIARAQSDHFLPYIIRDFKKFTSVMVCRCIEENQSESRKEWLLEILSRAAGASKKHSKYKLWQNAYHPVELTTPQMMDQKLDYIHNNPLKDGIVDTPEAYLYSSATNYAGKKGLLDVTLIE